MTLCIAAHAEHEGDRKIVLCFDWLVGDELGTTETMFKCVLDFAPGLTAMFSGNLEDAEDLLRLYKRRLASVTLTLESYKDELWAGMQEFKSIVSGRTYRKKSDVQLIVAGFIESDPKVIYAGPNGIAVPPFFQTIGTGASAADVLLRWRNPTQFSNLREVMYFVYEAKKLAETSPYVGKQTTILVIEEKQDGGIRWHVLKPRGFDALKSEFEKFGPKPFAPDDKFPWNELL